MKIQTSKAALLSAAFAAAPMLAASAQAHDVATAPVSSSYQMAAIIDRARGNTVVAGDYGEAIEHLGRKNIKRFEASTNLCVAYTMIGDLKKADSECAAALELSKSSAARRDVAIALSNLGVVKAVSGDISGARQDFSRALEINIDLRQASDNLELLREVTGSDA